MDFFSNSKINLNLGKVNIMIKDPTPIKQFKLMLVGNSGVGKSKVCEVLCSDNQNFNPISKFDENLNNKGTIGVEMHFKTLYFNEKLIIKVNYFYLSLTYGISQGKSNSAQ